MTSPVQAMVSLGAWSEITVNQSKEKAYLEKANLIAFAPLPDREGLLASLVMQVILQILLIDEEIEKPYLLYQRLVEVRKHMDLALSSYIKFLVQYLEDQGLPIIVDYCVNCQNKLKIVGINPQLGGFICQSCFAQVSGTLLSAEALKLMRIIKHQPYTEALNSSLMKMLLPLVHEHFNFHLDVQFEGFKTIEKLTF
jgi:recombinational DNA repair protein (RecF pathway)